MKNETAPAETSSPRGPSHGPLRILFAGSPAIAVPSLEMIAAGALEGRWVLAGALTNPDSRRGRSDRPEPTDVGAAAQALAGRFTGKEEAAGAAGERLAAPGLSPPAILAFDTLKAEAREAAAALRPDLLVSFAYGKIFGPRFMALFPLGGINAHPSLLPRYRGASPIQEAILRGDAETGVCVQRIAAEMDTGNILARTVIPLSGTETAASLSETAAVLGAEVLQKVLEQFADALASGEAPPEGLPQRGEASYCGIIGKDAGIIDWEESAAAVAARVRAYNPWPLTRTAHRGRVLHILEARPLPEPGPPPAAGSGPAPGPVPAAESACAGPESTCPGRVLGTDRQFGILVETGQGILGITRLQYRAKKALPWRDFLNGARDFIGSRLQGGGEDNGV